MSATEHEPERLPAARSAVVDAMRDVTASDRPRVAGWLNTWAPVDETGHVGPAFAIGPHPDDDLYTDLVGALSAIGEPDPVAVDVIDVEALYSPELQRVLEVAERIARDSGATTVDVIHVEIALAGRSRGGESPDNNPQ